MARIERHHILEIITTKDGSDGDYGTIIINSKERLKELGIYGSCHKENYGLPSWMICTCTSSEHKKLHMKFDKEWNRKHSESIKGHTHSEETKKKMSESRKGRTHSFFGAKFKEHFGITKHQDRKLYKKEHAFYKYHGYFSWEQ